MTVLWVIVGYSMCFGESLGGGLIGNPATYFMMNGVAIYLRRRFEKK